MSATPSPPVLYPNRTIMHRYMAPPESCDRCNGRGWFPTEDAECYCDCPAGDERRRVEGVAPNPPTR